MVKVWLLSLLLFASVSARADAGAVEPANQATAAAEAMPAPGRPRVLPTITAVVPGLLVHGTGHFVAGETRTGYRLLAAEGAGLGLMVAGIAGLAVTGASPKTIGPFIAVSALGGGLFGSSALADIYGVLAPEGGFGRPLLQPALELEVGPRYVRDPIFDYDAFSHVAATSWLGDVRVQLSGWLGLGHDNQRLRALGAYRLLRSGQGSYIDLELGASHHRFAPERFSTSFAEASVTGRLELSVLGRTLAGSFFDYGLGYALGANRQFDTSTESDEMMLARFGFGFFIGDGGDVTLYYDHRHDGFAAGLKVPGLGSGPLGHFGLHVRHFFSEDMGASLFAESGSAYVVGLSLLLRRRTWQ
ncbi:MAG: hypothetical protein OEZ06_05655 [Myxococcales bacterium]|nr:hypothetical protein [Myxococcales bacterium]